MCPRWAVEGHISGRMPEEEEEEGGVGSWRRRISNMTYPCEYRHSA